MPAGKLLRSIAAQGVSPAGYNPADRERFRELCRVA